MDSLLNIKKRIRRLTVLIYSGQAVIKIITTVAFGGSAFLLLDYIIFLPSTIRLVFLILLSATGIITSAIYKFNPIQLLEENFHEFNGRLFASLSFYRKAAGYSNELIEQIRLQASSLMAKIDTRPIIIKQLTPLLKRCIIGCIIAIIGITLLPSPRGIRLKRLVFPNHKYLSLSVYPGDTKLSYGDSVEIEVKTYGLIPRNLSLITNEKRFQLRKEQGFKTLVEVTEDINYYAKIGDVSSDTHRIVVMLKPWLKNIELSYNYPAYTGVPTFASNVPSIEALYGTQIQINAQANVDLDSAILHLTNINGGQGFSIANVEGHKLQANFTVTQNDSYQIELFATNGLKNTSEKWAIRVWEDESPKVELIFPGTDIELPVSMKIPIIFHVSDDYGISKTNLGFATANKSDKEHITNALPGDTVIDYEWELTQIPLLPGEMIKYWIEVYDNDAIKGPKITKSQEYTIYFPRVDEIYDQIVHQETKAINELEKALKELQTSTTQLEKMDSQFSAELSWEDKEQIKKTINKMREIETKLKEVGAKLDALYKTVEKSWNVDRELAEKIKELQNLYREVNLPQLNEAMRKVEEAIHKNPELLEQALKNLKLTQEEIRQRVERTIELLKQFRNEQLLKSLAEKAKEIEQWQKEVNEQTAKGDSLGALAKEEEIIQEEVSKLAKDLEKISKQLTSMRKELEQEANRASITEGQISEAAEQLSKGKKPLKLQRQILNQLATLSSNLNSLYQKTVQQGKTQLSREIKRLQTSLLFLSFEEENVGTSRRPPLQRAFRQQAIIKGTKIATQQLQALIKTTPFIPHSIQKHLANALNLMEQAKRHFEDTYTSTNQPYTNELQSPEGLPLKAMAELNQAVAELIKAEEALQKSCSASGIPSLMQQLAQITQNQQSLNQLVQALLPLNIMPGEMGEQLMQLSAQQQALADELQQIAQGLKGKVLGDLGRQAQEMERIAKDLKQGITKEIVERQKQVLKHLLDSQKSIYTKKKSRRRIAEPGKNFYNLPSPPPPELITKRGISQKEILNALTKLNRLNYPKEYELLIRAYFRALAIE